MIDIVDPTLHLEKGDTESLKQGQMLLIVKIELDVPKF